MERRNETETQRAERELFLMVQIIMPLLTIFLFALAAGIIG